MPSGYVIRKHEYYDSVFLMSVNKRLSDTPGIEESAVLMGTEANKRLLDQIGISSPGIDSAQPNDLIVAVIGETNETVADALENLDHVLKMMTVGGPVSSVRTLKAALERKPAANLAVFSVPGEYAADEARRALHSGLNVFIFSSNIPREQELELKLLGRSLGLLVMGPDCGTSILHGTGIGFANRVRRGTIGAVGPSGTGLQEFTSQVHNAGGGISHAIGTGSKDLSDAIGGLTTLAALQLLEDDAGTEVIAIVAKPPGKETLQALLNRGRTLMKPLIGCFLGIEQASIFQAGPIQWGRTIDDAAAQALRAAGVETKALAEVSDSEPKEQLDSIRSGWKRGARYLRGVFAGGTFCYQTQQILFDAGIAVYSNGPIDDAYQLSDPALSQEHTVVDMGDEHFTLGKPHPMIDSTERARRILVEAADPGVAILLLDFILGYNAANDPVGDLLDTIQEAQAVRRAAGGDLTIVASVCGTPEDPQDLGLQVKMLSEIGVLVFNSNARATKFCVQLLKGQVV